MSASWPSGMTGCEMLIAAFQIFGKYSRDKYLIHCEHDEMYVCVPSEKVSPEDIESLRELGFPVDLSTGNFHSFRFGSC